jgi:hypothetical protein
MNRKPLIMIGVVIAALALAWMTDFHHYLARRILLDKDLEGYPVSFTADDMYAVTDFSLPLQFSDFVVTEGILIPGTTAVGTTVVLILGDGEWRLRQPEQYSWTHVPRDSSAVPFSESFTSLYLRIHPRFYEELISNTQLTRMRDPEAFARAERIYKHKFWNSFHTGERALIPSSDIGTIDIESASWGRLQIHEGRSFGPMEMPPEVLHWDYVENPPRYMD